MKNKKVKVFSEKDSSVLEKIINTFLNSFSESAIISIQYAITSDINGWTIYSALIYYWG